MPRLFITFQLEERRETVAMKAIAGTGALVLILLLSTAGLSDEEGVHIKWKYDPDSAKAYYNRGVQYHEEGDFDKAISFYTEAIKKKPEFVEAYYNRGLAYREGEGDYGRAIHDFDMATEIDPKFAEAYYSRGIAYQREGQYEKAWEDVHEAHSLGYEVDQGFLKALREATGRQEKDNRKDTEQMPENKDWFQ
jgi:tetratricopeptide (TPR) repeat protein